MTATSSIDDRSRHVLCATVERYVVSAEPVASKVLTQPLRLSSALIRAVMGGLETQGLLQQPHHSAGRIPTDAGYRVYVDGFGRAPAGGPGRVGGSRLLPREDLERRAAMRASTSALTAATGLTGFAVAARNPRELLHYLELVRLGERQVLAVFVGSAGTIRQRMIRLDEDVSESDLVRFRNVFVERFRGTLMTDLRAALEGEIAKARDARNDLEERAFRLTAPLVPDADDTAVDVSVAGQHLLLGFPEFQVGSLAARVLEELERQETWLHILQAVARSPGVTVIIGRENPVEGLRDCALVATSVQWDGDQPGTVGLLGPTRMAYSTVMAAVEIMRASVAILGAEPRGHG